MKRIFLLFVLASLVVVQAAPLGAATLYDDFSTSNSKDYIKKSLWLDHWNGTHYIHEIVREIQNDALVLKCGTNQSVDMTRVGSDFIYSSAIVDSMQSDITIIETNNDEPSDMATVFGRIGGLFYNTVGAPYNGFQNDIWVEFAIGRQAGEDDLTAWYSMETFDGPELSSTRSLGGGFFLIGPSADPVIFTHGTTYTLSITRNGTNFSFEITDGGSVDRSITTGLGPGYPVTGPAHAPFSTLQAGVHEGSGEYVDGYVHAIFDNASVTADSGAIVISDNFTGTVIDRTKWTRSAYVRESTNELLRLETKGAGGHTRSRANLRDRYTPHLGATAQIISGSQVQNNGSPETNARGRVRIGGNFFNTTHPEGSAPGSEGEVFVQVALELTETIPPVPVARAIMSESNMDGSAYNTFFAENFSMPISFDTNYDLSIDFFQDEATPQNSYFEFKVDNGTTEETRRFDFPDSGMAAYNPTRPGRLVESRLWLSGDQTGTIKGTIDDVTVADPAYDLTGDWEASIADGVITTDPPGACVADSGSSGDLVEVAHTNTELIITDPANGDALLALGVISGSRVLVQMQDYNDDNLFYNAMFDMPMSDQYNMSGMREMLIYDTGCEEEAAISLVRINNAPTADPQLVTTDEDTPVDIELTGDDPDGDSLTYAAGDPSNGSLSGTAPNLTYTPTANYNGSDSFTFTVSDGRGGVGTATVNITVNAVNDLPIANDQDVTTNEDTPVGITLSGSDVESGGSLGFTVASDPSNGSLSGTAPDLTYTPDSNYFGTDSFTFTVDDGDGGISAPATVTITVNAVNDVPVANSQSTTTNEDTPVGITLTGSDDDGDALTYAVAGGPSNGSLSGTAPNLTYTPAANYNGSDSFTFTVNDGVATSGTATVSITVNAVNDAPVANDQPGVTTNEDTPVAITLSATDVDVGDDLTYTPSSPSNGTLSGTAPDMTYTPNTGYYGSDSFTFTVDDGNGGSDTGTVTIFVNRLNNDIPVAEDQSVTFDEDSLDNAITLNATDGDGDTLTYTLGTGPSNGTLSGTPPNVQYTPNDNYNGADSFTFTVNDGWGGADTGTVSITITSIPDDPVAEDQTLSLTPNSVDNPITCVGTDGDGDTLSYTLGIGPTSGTLTGTAPDMLYTPNPDFVGTDTFTFTVDDGNGGTDTGTVTMNVGTPGRSSSGGCFIGNMLN